MALMREVLDRFEKSSDIELVVSKVRAEGLGGTYVEIREQAKTTGNWGRGILIPVELAGKVAATVIDGLDS